MRIDVLHIEDCANWDAAGRLIIDVLSELGVADVSPRFTVIRSTADAARLPFAGSPTILIDGVDIVGNTAPIVDLACRIYREGGRSAGIPSRETVREAIRSRLGSHRKAAD
jgi:hypothetical protein